MRSWLYPAVELRPGKIRRCLAQDLVRLPELAVLPLKRLELLGDVRRDAAPLAAVDLGLLRPFVQRLRRATDLGRHGFNRRPARCMLMLVIADQPNLARANLR